MTDELGTITADETATTTAVSSDTTEISGTESEITESELSQDASTEHTDGSERRTDPAEKEEPDVAEFRGHVSARLKGLVKQSPKLAEAFKENPKLQEQIEATFRREAALREIFPTVAEARQMREHFPNGLSDVQQLLTDVSEVERLDKDFYSRDGEGNYPGHTQLLSNMFQDDREATVAFFKGIPKEWARLDRDSYDEVMRQVVSATLNARGIPEYIGDLLNAAKEAKQDGLSNSLQKLLHWAQGYTADKPRPTPEEERLSRDRQSFNREKQEAANAKTAKFRNDFDSDSNKLQLNIINNHPDVKRLTSVQTLPADKRADISRKVQAKIGALLKNSTSFMRKLRAAYNSGNLEETKNLQQAAWSQPWLLNKMVREVLRTEIPNLVQSNREAVRRRAGTPAKPPVKPGERKPTGPRQVGGRWYKADGTPFTSQEVLAGKHLQA